MSGRLRIERSGHHTSVQDTGRPTSRWQGVPRSGVVDRFTNAQLNSLVGNLTSAAVLETGGGLVVTAMLPTTVVSTSHPTVSHLETGDRIEVEPADGQRWGYLAVRGGLDVPTVMGSRSRDHLCAMGPLPILDGSTLDVGFSGGDDADLPVGSLHVPPAPDVEPVGLHAGPHAAQLPAATEAIVSGEWIVDHQRPREYVVLTGVDLGGAGWTPMWGFPQIEGAITLARDGSLHVSLCNDTTCTGDPVVGVVGSDDLARLAQQLDGARCRFTAPG